MIDGWAWQGVAKVLLEEYETMPASRSRYPHTYAYDLLRGRPKAFGCPTGMSRAETSGWLRETISDPVSRYETVCMLADTYMAVNRIEPLPDKAEVQRLDLERIREETRG